MNPATITPFEQADSAPVRVAWTEAGMAVTLRGALDAGAVPALRAAFLAPHGEGRWRVRIDGGAVTSVSAEGLAALLSVTSYLRDSGGELTFTRAAECLRQAATAAGVADLLPWGPAPAGQLLGWRPRT